MGERTYQSPSDASQPAPPEPAPATEPLPNSVEPSNRPAPAPAPQTKVQSNGQRDRGVRPAIGLSPDAPEQMEDESENEAGAPLVTPIQFQSKPRAKKMLDLDEPSTHNPKRPATPANRSLGDDDDNDEVEEEEFNEADDLSMTTPTRKGDVITMRRR